MKDILCPDEDKLEDSSFEFLFDIYHQDATNLEIFIFHVVTTYINEGIAGLYTNMQKYYTVHEHAEISKKTSICRRSGQNDQPHVYPSFWFAKQWRS